MTKQHLAVTHTNNGSISQWKHFYVLTTASSMKAPSLLHIILGPTCCLKAHVENPLFIWRSNQSHIVLASLPVLSEPCHHHKINDPFNALAVLGQWCYRTHMFEERRWVLGEWCGHITPVSFTFPVPSSLVPSVGWVGLNSEFISLIFFF